MKNSQKLDIYKYKLDKYINKYYKSQSGGNCSDFTDKECGILESGRCGKVPKGTVDENQMNECICNNVTGFCVIPTGIRGLRVRVNQLEKKVKMGFPEPMTRPPSVSQVSDHTISIDEK